MPFFCFFSLRSFVASWKHQRVCFCDSSSNSVKKTVTDKYCVKKNPQKIKTVSKSPYDAFFSLGDETSTYRLKREQAPPPAFLLWTPWFPDGPWTFCEGRYCGVCTVVFVSFTLSKRKKNGTMGTFFFSVLFPSGYSNPIIPCASLASIFLYHSICFIYVGHSRQCYPVCG